MTLRTERFLGKTWDAPTQYLVNEMLSVLHDTESEGYYRRVASTAPKSIIFEALSLVKRAVAEGKIRKSRGALFVAIVKRACADRDIRLAGRAQLITR